MTHVLRPLTNGLIKNNFYTPAPLSAEHRQRILSYSVFYQEPALTNQDASLNSRGQNVPNSPTLPDQK